MRKPVYAICEQKRRRSACASAQSNQRQLNDLCAQRRLRSAWASAQSDQSLRCPHEGTLSP